MASLRTVAALTLATAHGVRAEPSKAAVAEELSDPIASLTGLQAQSDLERNGGPSDRGFRWTLTLNAVLPIAIDDRWTVISRSNIPITRQAGLADAARQTGLEPASQSLFLGPKQTQLRGLAWGVGPSLQFPATDPRLGAPAFGLGPTAALVHMLPPVTYGVLLEHVWLFGASAETYLQPQIAYALGDAGTTLRVRSEALYTWSTRQWTVPVITDVAQVVSLGGNDLELAIGPIAYLERAPDDPRWGVRVTATLAVP